MIKQIKTFTKLMKVEDEAYASAMRGDLCFTRRAFVVFQGFVLVVARDTLEDFKKGMYFISFEDYDEWPENAQRYFKETYLRIKVPEKEKPSKENPD